MSKRPIPPPPGDRPTPAAPPPPPGWRHWLWPIAIGVILLLYLFFPATHISSPAELTYSQFISNASAHKIKTVTFGSNTGNTSATGTLRSGSSYTTVIPGQPTPQLTSQLTGDG